MKNFLLADSSELFMMYALFMQNFHLACWNKLMAVRLISAFWPQKHLILLSRHDVRRVHEKFSSRLFEQANGCWTHFGLLSPKTFDSYFLDMMYVVFMKNFLADSSELFMMYALFMQNIHLACWNKLMAVRLILAFWAQKHLIPTSRHDVRRLHEKFSSP